MQLQVNLVVLQVVKLNVKENNMPTKRSKKKKPCWDGYVKKGLKKKGNRMVNNCVPIKKKK